MNMLMPGRPGDDLNAPTYSIKIRGLTYIWGSAGLTQDVVLADPFLLHIANDIAGQTITVGTRVAAGGMNALGQLKPGECVTVSVNNMSGVYAECPLDSLVHCLINKKSDFRRHWHGQCECCRHGRATRAWRSSLLRGRRHSR